MLADELKPLHLRISSLTESVISGLLSSLSSVAPDESALPSLEKQHEIYETNRKVAKRIKQKHNKSSTNMLIASRDYRSDGI